jgi:hypothetical protein
MVRQLRMADHVGGEMGPVTQGPRSPGATVTPTLPSSFIFKEHQEAALRECGLPAKISANRNVRLMSVSAASRHGLAWLSMDQPMRHSSRQVGWPRTEPPRVAIRSVGA